MPTVTPIIVNYRTPKLTVGAVRSCLSEPEVDEVIIIDNASDDGSADIFTETFRGQKVRILEMSENLGFGAANNKAVGKAHGDYVFFLNSDAHILDGCIGTLLKRMEDDVTIGICAPEVLESDGTTVQRGNYGPFPTPRTIFTRNQSVENPLEPDWVSGVCMMIHKHTLLDIDGFDDEFFMYFEDVDLCRRMRLFGKRIVREPKAKIVHFGGGSLKSDFKRKKLYYESQDRYLELTGVKPFTHTLIQVARWPAYVARFVTGR